MAMENQVLTESTMLKGHALARPRLKVAGAYLGAAALSLLILVWVMQLWRADLRVPFTYYSEAMFNALLVKGVLEQGWHLTNPALSAPTGLDLRDVPMSDNNFHFLLIKLLSLFTSDYGLVINLFFLLTFPLTTLSALYVFRQFKFSFTPALFGSLLYTFLPFHFIRGQHHLFLAAYYLVPLVIMVTLWVAAGSLSWVDEESGRLKLKLRQPKWIFSLVVCLLVASSGTYYAYFACFFLLIAGSIITLRRKNARCLLLPCVLVAVIFAGLMANLLPSILYLRQHGDTPVVKRYPVEAETYALRISQLLMPVLDHRLFWLAKLKSAFNLRLLINENDDASLGIIGSLGFLTLLGWLLFKKPEVTRLEKDGTGGVLSHLSMMNLAAVLFATIGGLGALVALILTSKIRAYNRISIYIAFFSLFTVAVLLDHLYQRCRLSQLWRNVFYAGLVLALVFGVLDQTSPRFVPDYAGIKAEYQDDDRFINRVEASLSPGAMIFQLPVVPFPENPKVNKMYDYDHVRAYLHSRNLRWSYGAMKGRAKEVWQKLMMAKPTSEMVETLAWAGFSGVYLNRNGYADNGAKLETELAQAVGKPPLQSDDHRLVFFDLTEYQQKLKAARSLEEQAAQREAALHPLLVVWRNGCWDLEGTTENNWRWCDSRGELQITNGAERPRRVTLEMSFAAENDANLWITSPLLTEQLRIGFTPKPFSKTITIPPGEHTINFASDARRVLAPGDFRHLILKINNFKLTAID